MPVTTVTNPPPSVVDDVLVSTVSLGSVDLVVVKLEPTYWELVRSGMSIEASVELGATLEMLLRVLVLLYASRVLLGWSKNRVKYTAVAGTGYVAGHFPDDKYRRTAAAELVSEPWCFVWWCVEGSKSRFATPVNLPRGV